ncbi:hypothetical protein WMY93_021906 [Mugilogobius chulae]|uniref:Uncharacterized protein n=1 Tax=Mugilogobius chulae TaxID=88201 RepID=A0AAW0NHQ3_9GOBI
MKKKHMLRIEESFSDVSSEVETEEIGEVRQVASTSGSTTSPTNDQQTLNVLTAFTERIKMLLCSRDEKEEAAGILMESSSKTVSEDCEEDERRKQKVCEMKKRLERVLTEVEVKVVEKTIKCFWLTSSIYYPKPDSVTVKQQDRRANKDNMRLVTITCAFPKFTDDVTEEQMKTVTREATEDVCLDFESLEELEQQGYNTLRMSLEEHVRKRYIDLIRAVENRETAQVEEEEVESNSEEETVSSENNSSQYYFTDIVDETSETVASVCSTTPPTTDIWAKQKEEAAVNLVESLSIDVSKEEEERRKLICKMKKRVERVKIEVELKTMVKTIEWFWLTSSIYYPKPDSVTVKQQERRAQNTALVTMTCQFPKFTDDNITEEQMRNVMMEATEDVCLEFESFAELKRLSLKKGDNTIRMSLEEHVRKRYIDLRRAVENKEAAMTSTALFLKMDLEKRKSRTPSHSFCKNIYCMTTFRSTDLRQGHVSANSSTFAQLGDKLPPLQILPSDDPPHSNRSQARPTITPALRVAREVGQPGKVTTMGSRLITPAMLGAVSNCSDTNSAHCNLL